MLLGKKLEDIREYLGLSKKVFAEKLEITQNSYTNYIQEERQVPTDVAQILYEKFGISMNWFISGEGDMLLTGAIANNSPAMEALKNAIAVANNETIIADKLKQITLEIINKKLFPKEDSFFQQLSEIIFPKTQRIILFMYTILNHIATDDRKKLDDDPTKYLIEKIQRFDLLTVTNLGHGFTIFDKKKLISMIEKLSGDEAKVIVSDARKAADTLRENLDFLNKITY
jgi:plasmid maintenance system antidote protein VapI